MTTSTPHAAKAATSAGGPSDQPGAEREARRPPPPSPPTRRRTPSPPPPTPPRARASRPGSSTSAMPAPVATPLPPRKPSGDGEHVAEHGREPARHPDRPVAGGQAAAPPARAPLATSPSEHDGAGPAAHRAERVGRARVPGALLGGVAALAAAHQDGGGEGPQQVGGDHEQPRQLHRATLRSRQVCGSGGSDR